jgi:hypothetical protein
VSWEDVLNETLVDAHLEAVPGLGTLTARGLAGGDLEGLGGQADGTLGAEVLGLSTLDDLSADLLEDLDLAGGQGDADLVGLLYARKERRSASLSMTIHCCSPSLRFDTDSKWQHRGGGCQRTGASPRSLSALL